MSMNCIVPFENGVNADSIIRRLKNVKRGRRKMERNNTKIQTELIRVTTGPTNPPSPPSDSGKGEENPFGTVNSECRTSGHTSGYTTPDMDNIMDENGNIRPDATIIGGNGERRNLNDIIARLNDPNAEWIVGGDPTHARSRASVMREEEEEIRKKGIPVSPRFSPPHSSQASSSSGYIPPPEEHTPGGTRKWKYRDYLAGRLPITKRYQRENGRENEPQLELPLFTSEKPDPDEVRWAKSDRFVANFKNSERIDRSSRGRGRGIYDQDRAPGPERDVEIKIKLQLSVDPLLLGISENNEDETGTSTQQLPRSTRKPLKRNGRRVAFSTQKAKKTGNLIQELADRGLRIEALILIVALASVLIGFMAGSNVCR